MKFAIQLRTSKNTHNIIGFIFELNRQDYQFEDATRTTIAIIPPHKHIEGIAIKIWGYDKTTAKNKEVT